MNSSFLIVAATILVAVTERQLQHMAGFNDCNSKYTKLLPLLLLKTATAAQSGMI